MIKSTVSEILEISGRIVSTVSNANLNLNEKNIELVFEKIAELNARITLYQVLSLIVSVVVGIVPIICVYLQGVERVKDIKENNDEKILNDKIFVCETAKTIATRYYCWAVEAHAQEGHEIYDKKVFTEIDKELAELQVKFSVYFGKELYQKLWAVAMKFQEYGLYKKEIDIDSKDYMEIIDKCIDMINKKIINFNTFV